ncbi:hypothetical protein [Ketogulonicigenium robustum]|nr:hypothetical protein [Ketogulonicigenium robustum]
MFDARYTPRLTEFSAEIETIVPVTAHFETTGRTEHETARLVGISVAGRYFPSSDFGGFAPAFIAECRDEAERAEARAI